MDKQDYRQLLMLVNNEEQYQRLLTYVDARIHQIRQFLDNEKDHHRILEMQGSIAELKRIKTLRDEVIKGAE